MCPVNFATSLRDEPDVNRIIASERTAKFWIDAERQLNQTAQLFDPGWSAIPK